MEVPLNLSDPLRPPDARVRLARELVANHRYAPSRMYGTCVSKLVRYLRSGPIRQVGLGARPADQEPALTTAFSLHYDQPQLAAVLEALVLADESVSSIAAYLGIAEDAVQWYETAFYDVRDRLSAVPLILAQVIEPARRRAPDALHGYACRLGGFLIGASAVRALVGGPQPSEADLLATRRQATERMIELQLQSSATQGDLDARQVAGLVRVLGVLRQQAETGDVPLNEYVQNVDAVLSEMKWYAGNRKPPPSLMDEYDGLPVVLLPEEMSMLARGERLPNEAALKAMKLPEPRARREHKNPEDPPDGTD